MEDVLSKKGVAITSTFSIDKLETMDEDGEEIRDPHFWFNVGLYKEACENVAKELINLMPEDKDYIEDKLTAYTGELDELDTYIKERLALISKEFAHLVGIKTGLIFYALMCLTSFTSVIAFDSVGSILVISFFISSAATALLLARSLLSALVLSGAIGCFNSLIGYLIAIRLNTSMSGTVAFVAMVSYMALLLFAKEGAFTKAIRRAKDKRTLVYDALLVHLGGHTEKARFSPENNVDEIIHHINWEPAKLNKVTSRMQMKGYIMIVDNYYLLTEKGKKRYQALKSLLPSS